MNSSVITAVTLASDGVGGRRVEVHWFERGTVSDVAVVRLEIVKLELLLRCL